MAAIWRADLIKDSSFTKQYNPLGQPTLIQIDRACWVSNIDQADPAQCVSIAEQCARANIPIGTAHPVETLAKARNYRVATDAAKDQMQVVVSYMFSADGFPDLTWTVECDTFLEQVQTDTEYDGEGGVKAIMVSNYFLNWKYNVPSSKDSDAQAAAQGTANVLYPRKRVVMTRTIYSPTDAATLESASDDFVGTVNSATFRGKAVHTWLCDDVSVSYDAIKGIYMGRLSFIYRPETWNEWTRWSNSQLGVPPNIWKYDSDGNANGMKQVNVYLENDFNDLVGILG